MPKNTIYFLMCYNENEDKMTSGEIILAIVGFLTYPTWHLVALFVILLLIVALYMYKSMGF